MSDETQKAARVIARDLLNAISEGMDIAGTVDQVVHKVAAVGGSVDTTIQKYGLDSGQVAALAVLMDDVPLVEPVDIDYAAVEKRLAAEMYGTMTGRSMALGEGLTVMVEGGLHSWRAAQAIYSMMSGEARDGLAEYFVEHGIKPIDGENLWQSKTIVAALLAHATLDTGLPPEIIAAQCGTLAFLALVRHSEELSAMDGSPLDDGFTNMAHLGESITGRNPSEPEIQNIPGNPFLSNPDFRTEGTVTGRLAPGPNLSNLPKEAMTAYCLRCKTQVVPAEAEMVEGNGSPVYQGKCPTCDQKVRRQLPKAKKDA